MISLRTLREILWATRAVIEQSRDSMAWVDAALASPTGTLLRSLVQFFFQPVAISDVQHVKLLELVQQLLRRSRVVTVTLPLGDDLALVGNMPLGFDNVSLSLRQMVQYQGSVWHTRPTPDSVRPFRRYLRARSCRGRAGLTTAKMAREAA